MDLTDDEIRDLAAFLARRVTPEGLRPDPTDAPPAGRTPHGAWVEVLASARSSGRLPGLVRQAAAAAPDDRALQEASTLFAPRPRIESVLVGGLFVLSSGVVAALALVTFATLGVLSALEAVSPVPADIFSAGRVHPFSPDRPPSPAQAVASAAALPAAADAATRAGDVGPDALAPGVAPGLPALGVATRVPRVEDGPPEGPMERDACAGWFYAGERAPGESFVVTRRTNVRVLHPSRENGWNRRARITCVLEPGTLVTLAGEPIGLPGGHWWAQVGHVAKPVDVALAD